MISNTAYKQFSDSLFSTHGSFVEFIFEKGTFQVFNLRRLVRLQIKTPKKNFNILHKRTYFGLKFV